MIERILTGCVLLLALAAGAASADEAFIKKAVESKLPNAKVESVKKTPYLGLYEVVVAGEILYTDEKAQYFFAGSIIDAKTMKDLTEERRNKLIEVKFDTLPLDMAVKAVRGNGKRTMAIFADPNCGYCKKLEKEMANVTDVTIYYFLYPILAPTSTDKSKAVWCNNDPVKAWNDMMQRGVDPPAINECNAPIQTVLDLGRKLRVNGTPTIIFMDGSRIPGAVSVAEIEKQLNATTK
jgi:thiol:disulfide interchange protein DsbC